MLRRFERAGPDTRSLPELVKQLEHNQDAVRFLAIKFLALAGPSAKEAIPALDRMREDPNADVRKQAQAASDRIKSKAESNQGNGNARKTASTWVFGSTPLAPAYRASLQARGEQLIACRFRSMLQSRACGDIRRVLCNSVDH
jgi:HEAT repeat protein